MIKEHDYSQEAINKHNEEQNKKLWKQLEREIYWDNVKVIILALTPLWLRIISLIMAIYCLRLNNERFY